MKVTQEHVGKRLLFTPTARLSSIPAHALEIIELSPDMNWYSYKNIHGEVSWSENKDNGNLQLLGDTTKVPPHSKSVARAFEIFKVLLNTNNVSVSQLNPEIKFLIEKAYEYAAAFTNYPEKVAKSAQ